METKEMMMNETVMEAVEEMTASGSKNFMSKAAGVAATGVVIYLGGKYIVKPAATKVANFVKSKIKKNADEAEVLTRDDIADAVEVE